jgi:hypothetical protein
LWLKSAFLLDGHAKKNLLKTGAFGPFNTRKRANGIAGDGFAACKLQGPAASGSPHFPSMDRPLRITDYKRIQEEEEE